MRTATYMTCHDNADLPDGWVLSSWYEDEPGERRYVLLTPWQTHATRETLSVTVFSDENDSYLPAILAAIESAVRMRPTGVLSAQPPLETL